MLRTIAVALAIATVVGANMNMMPLVLTHEDTTTTTTTVAPQIPPSERLVTGGNLEYTKLIKGSIERDPLSWRTYISKSFLRWGLEYCRRFGFWEIRINKFWFRNWLFGL